MGSTPRARESFSLRPRTLAKSDPARRRLCRAAVRSLCESLETRLLLAANDPVISEFMADNTTGLVDGKGKHGDWIEIFNPGASPVDMAGWHLTDNAQNLTEYTFPSFVIPAGGYGVVFATGEATPYVDASGYPHTNFKLDPDGEYLALVKPDGVTKTRVLNPYPAQSANISYGFGAGGTEATDPAPFAVGNTLRVRSVSSFQEFSPIQNTWKTTTYDDTTDPKWVTATNGIGFEGNPADPSSFTPLIQTDIRSLLPSGTLGVYMLRVKFNIPDPSKLRTLRLRMRFDDGFVAFLNGTQVASVNAPGTVTYQQTATSDRPKSSALVPQDFDLTSYLPNLVAGNNVLAIQLLNSDKTSNDLLAVPELFATQTSQSAPQYFATPTPGAANVPGNVVINEIHYNPDVKTQLVEFVELFNPSPQTVDVSGWRLADAVSYTIPAGTTIPSGGYLVISQNPTQLNAKYGKSSLGPYTGSLGNNGETLKLLTANSGLMDQVGYGAGFPWPTVGDALTADGTGPSIQLVNALADNDLGGAWRSALPTPGAANTAVVAGNPAPNIRQVSNSPTNPVANQPVTVTAKITDDDGMGAVTLKYQVNAPGQYVPSMIVNTNFSDPSKFTASPNPAYNNGWVAIPMYDDGTHGDSTPGDSVYSAQVPASVNQNRTLIRYKVTAADALGATVTAPYADDPSLNFAYYVYNGVPGWAGAVAPGSSDPNKSQVVNYTAADMNRLPVYQLIARNQDVIDAQHIPPSTAGGYTGSQELWRGTLVYNGVVYDNVGFRVRGGTAWRYAMGKNKYEFNMNRNHGFQAYDNWGNPYPTKWDNFDLNAIIDQGNYWQRGEQGMFEGINNKLWQLVGVPSNDTAFMQLRVVDDAAESTPGNQYQGDLWGMYLATEANDGNFLDEHGLPDGNYYRMNPEDGGAGGGTLNNQGPYPQPSDNSDLVAFTNYYKNNSPDETWWGANLNLDEYYSYRTIIEAVHHYDVDQNAGKNYFYYHNPVTNKWEVHPWDSDLTWADNMYAGGAGGGDEPFKSRVLPLPHFNIAYKNRIREIRDLLWNTDQAYKLLDEYANIIDPVGVANSPVDWDRMMWDYNPIMAEGTPTSYGYGDKAGQGRYYAGNPGAGINIPAPGGFRGMVQEMKNYVVSRMAWLDSLAADPLIPNKPSVSYTGGAGFPVDNLKFHASNFASPNGNSTFAAMQWRVGETYDAGNPVYATGKRPYEVTSVWQTGELASFNADATVPANNLLPGHTYRLRVRMKDANGRWSDWSDPVQFVAASGNASIVSDLRVTEINYNPAPPPAGSPYVADDFEYVELLNKGTGTLDLTGVQFTNGISFAFPSGATLGAGQRTLVVKNLAAFQSRYGHAFDAQIAGTFAGTKTLSNSGDTLRLQGPVGQTILGFQYSDGWFPQTDGGGFSLVIVDPNAPASTWGDKAAWRASTNPDGDPGADVPGLTANSVVVNEILANPAASGQGFIEIRNNTASPIDLSYWYVSDDGSALQKYQIAAGSIVPAGGYLLLNQAATYGAAFALSRLGGSVYLSQGAAAGGPVLGYQEKQSYDPSDAGVTIGRYVKSTGKQDFVAMASPTPNAANASPKIGPVIIDEVMYAPPGGTANEFVELRNITDAPVDLSGWTFDGLTFTFPSGTVLPAHGYLIVAPIDPATFRTQYNVPAQTMVVGPFFGLLDDAGDDLRLLKPGVPGASITPYIPVDEVNYTPDAPWPTGAAGGGAAIVRQSFSAYGNDAASWAASAAGGSPGRPNFAATGTPAFDNSSAIPKFRVTFTEDVSGSLSANMLTLENLGGGSVPATSLAWDPTTLTATWTFANVPADANYRATLHGTFLTDWNGATFDGDANGTPGGDLTANFYYLGADANHDRSVDFSDLVAVAQHYNVTGGMTWADGDFTGDGNVDFNDLVILAQRYNTSLPAAAEAVVLDGAPVDAAAFTAAFLASQKAPTPVVTPTPNKPVVTPAPVVVTKPVATPKPAPVIKPKPGVATKPAPATAKPVPAPVVPPAPAKKDGAKAKAVVPELPTVTVKPAAKATVFSKAKIR